MQAAEGVNLSNTWHDFDAPQPPVRPAPGAPAVREGAPAVAGMGPSPSSVPTLPGAAVPAVNLASESEATRPCSNPN